jgi:hypothetical protein
MGCFLVILLFLIVLAFIITNANYSAWEDYLSGEDAPKLKWKQILEFRVINPYRWEITNCHIMYFCDGKVYYINLSFVEWIKYRLWFRVENKREQERKENKKLEVILNGVQADINKLLKTAEKEKAEALKKMSEINWEGML